MTWPESGSVLIENKLFSIPAEEQLARYSEQFDQNTSCWLLSLMDPGWSGRKKRIGRHEWHWKDYGELGSELESSLSMTPPSFERELAVRYANVVKRLARLNVLVAPGHDDDTVELGSEVADLLRGNQLSAGMVKVRASAVASAVLNAVHDHQPTRAGAGFSNGTPIVECFYALDGHPRVELGWQLQNGSFRLMIISRDEVVYRGREPTTEGVELAAMLADHLGVWPKLEGVLGVNSSGERSDRLYGFADDVIYRHRRVEGLTLGQLKAAARLVFLNATECHYVRPKEADSDLASVPLAALDAKDRPSMDPGLSEDRVSRKKDRTKYRVDGGGPLNKRKAALKIIKTWLNRNRSSGAKDLHEAFHAQLHPLDLFAIAGNIGTQNPTRYFVEPDQVLRLADGTEWVLTNQWAKDTLEKLAARAVALGISVEAVTARDPELPRSETRNP